MSRAPFLAAVDAVASSRLAALARRPSSTTRVIAPRLPLDRSVKSWRFSSGSSRIRSRGPARQTLRDGVQVPGRVPGPSPEEASCSHPSTSPTSVRGARWRPLTQAPSRGSPRPALRSAKLAFAAPPRRLVVDQAHPRPRRVDRARGTTTRRSIDSSPTHRSRRRSRAAGSVRLEPLRAWGSWPGLPEDLPKARNVEHDGTGRGADHGPHAREPAPGVPARQRKGGSRVGRRVRDSGWASALVASAVRRNVFALGVVRREPRATPSASGPRVQRRDRRRTGQAVPPPGGVHPLPPVRDRSATSTAATHSPSRVSAPVI